MCCQGLRASQPCCCSSLTADMQFGWSVTASLLLLMLQVLDEKYYAGFLNLVQPRQRDVTHVLAALVMVSCAMLESVNLVPQRITGQHCWLACLLLILGCSETFVLTSWCAAAPCQRHHTPTAPSGLP